ncbi:hypothetical protein ACFWM5_20770 [Streptomyces bobili]|uniref:hypothetical protein n=1 Tax=Streptomyces bobili TaxID=67280 RepID=UPI00364C9D09
MTDATLAVLAPAACLALPEAIPRAALRCGSRIPGGSSWYGCSPCPLAVAEQRGRDTELRRLLDVLGTDDEAGVRR